MRRSRVYDDVLDGELQIDRWRPTVIGGLRSLLVDRAIDLYEATRCELDCVTDQVLPADSEQLIMQRQLEGAPLLSAGPARNPQAPREERRDRWYS